MSATESLFSSPRGTLYVLFVAAIGFAITQPAAAQTCAASTPPSVLTAQYGNLRQGYNSSETTLTSTCLNNGTVTMKQPSWSPLMVDSGIGQANLIQAQPLYVSQITSTPALTNCPNPCNMLVSVTLTGSVFAWNADTGATIWSDCQRGTGCPNPTGNALWVEDCGQNGGVSLVQNGGTAGLPFAGIVSTPVIDLTTNPSQPVLYATSLCETSSSNGAQKWWIHQLNLYTGADQIAPQQIGASVSGSAAADDLSGSSIPFNAWETLQRAALLEVQFSGASHNPNPLVYVAFGFGYGLLGEKKTPYHGWVFAYDSSLTQQIRFVTTARGWGLGSNTDTPACTANCTCTSGDPGTCNAGSGCIEKGYIFAENWCGHAGGVWMSGRGPAANPDSSGVSHAYFGVGNGGFQQMSQSGSLLPAIQNWGNSVLDFRLGVSVFDTAPAEYFTPYSSPVQQPLTANSADGAAYTFEGLAQNDFDMAVSGIMLFDDLGANHRLLTIDKAGYGYLLTQGNLCGSSSGCYPATPTGGAGGVINDPGNAFSFAANLTRCPDQIGNVSGQDQSCDRVTSVAFYKDGSPPLVYFWPSYEELAAFQLSNNAAQSPAPAGTVTVSATSVTGSGTSFTSEVIVGDTLIAGGCTPGVTCPIITAVTDDTHLTISSSLVASSAPWNYSGYFVNPIYDRHPLSSNVQYPGGTLTVTSASGNGALVWALANVGASPGVGALYVYGANTFNLLYSSTASGGYPAPSAFTNATFALPTVANGYVYIPTAGITSVSGSNYTCSRSAPCSGIPVYSGH